MIWVDYCILALTMISMIIGALRGFTKELFGLLTWGLGFILAWLFGPIVADLLQNQISIPALRISAGYAVCFLGGLLLGAVLSMLLVESVRNSRLATADHTLGGGFGLLRALLVTGLFVMVAANMGAKEDNWWKESLIVGRMEWLGSGLQGLFPESWLEKIRPQPAAEEKS